MTIDGGLLTVGANRNGAHWVPVMIFSLEQPATGPIFGLVGTIALVAPLLIGLSPSGHVMKTAEMVGQ